MAKKNETKTNTNININKNNIKYIKQIQNTNQYANYNKNKCKKIKQKINIKIIYNNLKNKIKFDSKEFKITMVIIILLLIFFSFNNKEVININASKVKEIILVNYVTKDSGKKMIISEKENIKDIVNKLNSLKKVSNKQKLEYELDNDIINNFALNDLKNNHQGMIIEIDYLNDKKDNEILFIKENNLILENKTYQIKENNIQNMWYILNEKVENLNFEEIEKYNYVMKGVED